MADDITITSGNSAQNPAGGQTPVGQSVANPAVPAQQPAAEAQLNPVIDLSGIDQAPAQPAAPQPAGVQPVAAPQVGRRASNAIMLGADDEGAPPPLEEKYAIPAMVTESFPDLIQLIKQTESMNDEERDYWFQILPIMTEDQIKKFRDILVNEKAQLTNLDQEYEQELEKLNEKHMIEWKEFESKEKRKTITTAEAASKAQEKSEEEDLLKRLSQV